MTDTLTREAVVCDDCGNYVADGEDHACQAAAEAEAEAEVETVEVGDRVTVTIYDGSTFKGVLLARTDMTDDDAMAQWGMDVAGVRSYARRYITHLPGIDFENGAVETVLVSAPPRRYGAAGTSIETILTNHPNLLDQNMTVGDLSTALRNATGNSRVLQVYRGVVKITKAKPLPQLRPCDGLVLLGDINGDVGEGGEQGELPKGHRRNYSNVGLVIRPHDNDPTLYEIWTPSNGGHVWMNVENTKFHRTFQATRQNWCADRRKPILALANYMRDEYERDKAEEDEHAAF